MRCRSVSVAKFLSLLLLMTIASPLAGITAADSSLPTDIQAQNLNAEFNPMTESTTVTWHNINT